jgi:hypothetical protein
VATAITGIPELVEDGVSGFLVRPGRVDLLAERLAQLLSDPALRAAMGQAGRRKVLAEYDVARNAEELAGLFRARAPGAAASSAGEAPDRSAEARVAASLRKNRLARSR